ncbi:SxtJ family membrane protein [Mucilaginibacter pedocola]|uniref:SxtJ n=1 Tax=Mucilaginibacter pedocola TaxID=1792845 RepID=A0A1S9PAV7_9SPHI|nr:SxtJ family membrane protein [Mucilaginibacter pedocola]OOQ57728.1 hypothetical protein BC343_13120 [Mucilaginibacter pedocola]
MKATNNINRKFCLQMAMALLAVTALLAYKDRAGAWYTLGIAVVFALVGFVRPQLADGFRRCWLWLGELLGNINGVVMLSGIYFLVLTPLGLIRRLLGRDTMGRKFKTPAASYWEEPDSSQTSMEEQF